MTGKSGDGRGQDPASRANLERREKFPPVHGWYSAGIQTVGVPVRRSCPLRLLGGCNCDIPDGERCPPMIQAFTDRVVELQSEGIAKQAAELITKLEFQSALGHFVMDHQGAVRPKEGDGGTFRVHPVWLSVGCVDHALERLYKAAGLLRAGKPQAPTLGEYLKQREEKGGDDEEA